MQGLSIKPDLTDIPSKRYFTIGEVAKLCAVKPHVLRYWEQEFSQLKPVKRRGNRRYYQRADVEVVRTIYSLLYEQGFTITGARQQLSNYPDNEIQVDDEPVQVVDLEELIAELSDVADLLKS